MAGVAAAWRLSRPGWRERFESITIYQRDHLLGGKGASVRGVNGRIEEHGLHVWLGHYDCAFAMMREVYAELDRPTTDPDCPIRTIEEAFSPAPVVGLFDRVGDTWEPWVGHFATNDLVPGVPAPGGGGRLTPVEIVRRSIRLLADFQASMGPAEPRRLWLSPHPEPRPAAGATRSGTATMVLAAAVEALGLATESFSRIRPVLGGTAADPLVGVLDDLSLAVREALVATLGEDTAGRRTWHLISVVTAQVRGLIADGIVDHPERLAQLNDLDHREWLLRHGAAPEAVDSTLIRGLYDLVFGHVGGDPTRLGLGAGVGVLLSARAFFEYKGAIFFKMQAGMGDVVFAPAYQALRARGVEFVFHAEVEGLHLDPTGRRVDGITMQVPVEGVTEPLVRVGGLPCFPSEVEVPIRHRRTLRAGPDFDEVVFAISVGAAAAVTPELIARHPRWSQMCEGLATVPTRAVQLWLSEDEPTLGWDLPGSTMSGYEDPFDTWASMSHLIDRECWPADDRPRTIAYLCSTLPEVDLGPDAGDTVRAQAVDFLEHQFAPLLPGAVGPDGFRWDLLCGAGDAEGPGRFDHQFWVANVDPSDRYVQSLPGTDRLRLRPDWDGVDNLWLAGDWTDNGLNAGCIEAAVVSGLQAANAIEGRDRWEGIPGAFLDRVNE